jgi:hypothetical protein
MPSQRHALAASVSCTMALAMLLPICATSASAATLGSRCQRVGATSWNAYVKLRCAKVGNRLQWRTVAPVRPAPIVTPPVPGPQPEPDPQIGIQCSEVGAELLNGAGPIRCTGGRWTAIAPSEDSVASRAYRNLIAQYWANPESTIALKVISDSSTAFISPAIERSLRAADRLWSVSTSAYEPYPVVIAHDSDSVRTLVQQQSLGGYPASAQTIADQEAAYSKCAAASFNSGQPRPWFLFCFSVDAATAVGQDLSIGNVGAHEFTHLVEHALMGDILIQRTIGRPMAPWFAEGMASYTAVALGSVSGSSNDLRALRVEFLKSTRATLAEYNYSNSFSSSDVYLLGMFASEAFYALEGRGAMEKVLHACRTGLKFDAALKRSTGRALGIWTPILMKYIDSVKAGTPLTLAQLQDLKRRAFAAG